MFDYFANPTRFSKIARLILPWLEIITVACLGYGLYLALLSSPADYQQGDAVRIMYIHVPAAWIALSSYLLLGICLKVLKTRFRREKRVFPWCAQHTLRALHRVRLRARPLVGCAARTKRS